MAHLPDAGLPTRRFAVGLAAANRDEAGNPQPEVFDIARENVQHIAFGHGIHLCLGLSLARLEARIAFNALLDRFTDLALAEQAGDGQQLVASCSACYVNLQKVNAHIEQDPQLLDRINQALSVDGLEYTGTIRVRHLLDVISNDIGPEAIAAQAQVAGILLGVAGRGHHRQLVLLALDDHRRPFALHAPGQYVDRHRARVLGDDTPDSACGLKAFTRETFRSLPRFDHMHRFLPALVQRQGGRVLSLDITQRERTGGRSKYGLHNRLWVGIVDLLGVWWLKRRALRPVVEEGE